MGRGWNSHAGFSEFLCKYMCGHGEHVGRKQQDNQSPIQYSVFVHKKALHVLVMLRVVYKKEKHFINALEDNCYSFNNGCPTLSKIGESW